MKKEIIAISVSVILLVGLLVTFGIKSGNTDVKFEEVAGKNMPRELEAEICRNTGNLSGRWRAG